jgi:hypothetical protein
MIRKLLQSVLCICLAPLLAAQQVAQADSPSSAPQPPPSAQAAATAEPAQPKSIFIPQDTRIELVAQDRASLAAARTGSTVRFTVANDVLVNGVVAIHAGTPATAIVTNQRSGSHKLRRDGTVSIRARDFESGTRIYIRVANNRSVDCTRPTWNGPGLDPVKIGLAIAAIVIIVGVFGVHSS